MQFRIRHHTTQLFLTELLNLSVMDNPTFERFYLGLHLAATHDILKCLPLKLNLNKKQPVEANQNPSPMKPRRILKHQDSAELVS